MGCTFNLARAERAQRILSRRVVLRDDYPPLRRVAGLDVAYVRRGEWDLGIGVAVLLDYPSLRLRDCVAYLDRVCVPYVPGFLAFREMAVLGPALARLARPDILLVDGHGVAHPRRFGIASHVGVATGLPSIGVAKRRLVGSEVEEGGRVYIVHGGEKLGVVIARGRGKIYVSPGHRVSVEGAARLVEAMLVRGRKLPEPTRVADAISKSLRRRIAEEGPEAAAGTSGCRVYLSRSLQ